MKPERQRAIPVRHEMMHDGRQVAVRLCKECGAEFVDETTTQHGDFCCTAHRKAFLNRRQRRGLALIDPILRWLLAPADSAALADVCRMGNDFIAEDRESGRPSW